jgi:hypothetical protein
MMHEWWWFNRYESVNYPVHHNCLMLLLQPCTLMEEEESYLH